MLYVVPPGPPPVRDKDDVEHFNGIRQCHKYGYRNRWRKQRKRDAEESPERTGTVNGSRFLQIIRYGLQAGDIDNQVEADGLPDRDEHDRYKRKPRLTEPAKIEYAQPVLLPSDSKPCMKMNFQMNPTITRLRI